MSITRKCSGWRGKHACTYKYPDHMVPVEEFAGPWKSGGRDSMCKACRKLQKQTHNFLRSIVERLAGGRKAFFSLSVDDRRSIRDMGRKELKRHQNPHSVWTIFPRSPEPKPLRTVVSIVKPRDSRLRSDLKEMYNYTCQVLGCNEQEVDLAHLYPHRYDDSVDNETNATVLCKNHHWSLDHQRMYIEDDLSFTRYNLDGKVIEESIIECHEDHNIDAKFITKSQDWFLGGADDRKEQAVG